MYKNQLFFVLLSMVWSSMSLANNRFITDQIDIYVRSGPTTAYKLVDSVSTGEAVTLLETNTETGFSRIEDAKGKSFWIETRHITTEPPARTQLDTLKKELNELKANHEKKLREQSAKLRSHDQVVSENQKLTQQINELDNKVEMLEQFKHQAESRFQKDVFAAGGAIMAVGLLLGFIFSKFGGSKRRRDLF
ncbi:MAG: TIGR04211 family SH3 domain-containing protein [Pseudomonadota bacterium]